MGEASSGTANTATKRQDVPAVEDQAGKNDPAHGYQSYGEYLRSKNIRIEGCRSHVGYDRTTFKRHNKELDLYERTRKQGIAPAGTRTHQIRAALDESDRTGTPYDAGNDSRYTSP